MTTPNTIIADLSHEIDRLQKVSNLLLSAAIRAEDFISAFDKQDQQIEKDAFYVLLGDLRYAIDEAHHG